MIEIPAYPRDRTPAERRALMLQSARDVAAEAIRDAGADPALVKRDVLESEAVMQLTIAWLTERVAALEVAAAEARPPRNPKGAA